MRRALAAVVFTFAAILRLLSTLLYHLYAMLAAPEEDIPPTRERTCSGRNTPP